MRSPAVHVRGLRKAYGSHVAVADVSLDVWSGEIFGILGPNGAGKTTTVEMIAGLRSPDAGRVRVLGLDPGAGRAETTRVVGVQLQASALQPKITVREALELWSAFYADPEPWRTLAGQVGLLDHLDRRFGDLSGGQQQRLSLALALVGRPEVAILDELTTGLDPRARREVWDLVREVRERGTTVLLVTHAMEEAHHLCDRLAVIVDGRVRAIGTPEELIDASTAATTTSFDAPPGLDPAELCGLPGVSSVSTVGGRIVVEGSEGSALVVLDRLTRRGLTPGRVRVEDGSLDEAYLRLAHGATREKEPA